VADTWDSLTEGSTGIDLPLKTEGAFFYYTALFFVLAGLVATAAFARSKLGHGCVAIREDQDAARMLGINTTLYKVAAYAISAVFAAVAGGITAYQNIHVTPGDFFRIDYTLEMIIATIIGGPGSVVGPVLGAGVYQLLSTYVWSRFLELHPSVLGLIIVFFIVFLPRGLMQVLGRRRVRGERPFRLSDLLANVRAHRVT
jgi:branched-chain amino acid transport system permease protein